MKITLTTLFFLICCSLAFTQDVGFEVKGRYSRGISKEKLILAKTMSDIRHGFPSSWIETYLHTVIAVTHNGNVVKATGINETLTAEQQNLLKTAALGADIAVSIEYTQINPVTLFPEIRKMEFVETVVPEVEAEYPGGYEKLKAYLQQNAIDKLPSTDMKPAIIRFTISETGEITDAQVSKSSDNAEVDQLLLSTISRMPLWKPAQDGKGSKYPQQFEFFVGFEGC